MLRNTWSCEGFRSSRLRLVVRIWNVELGSRVWGLGPDTSSFGRFETEAALRLEALGFLLIFFRMRP